MFREIDAVPNLSKNEEDVLKKWVEWDVIEKVKENRKNSPEKVYYDGPITANNMPHYGHVVTWTLKDIIPRYWNMNNYYVSRNMGWDCQGLPVEIEVEKELGFKEKEDVEKYGIAAFNKLCKESVFRYRDQIFQYETRIGRWFDQKDMYYTLDATFIESIWWSFKELFNKGLIYEGYKVVPYSTRAGSALSHHEVNEGGYKEIEDIFITPKFKLKTEKDTYVLAWTTTPWTLPSNLLLAVGRKIVYVKVKFEDSFYILAKSRVSDIFKDKQVEILEEIKPSDLVGKEYEPLFSYYESKRSEGCFKIVYADHANDEDGTGIVHLAPYGEEDFDVFMRDGITIFDYLDGGANFTDAIPEYAGLFYKQANKVIVADLQKKNLVLSTGSYVHRMPMCYRTKTPLIYKPIKSWYVAVTKIKDKMLEQNSKINWVPEHLKNGGSFQWISNARDWSISRSRYWGTPMPVWVNDKTKEIYVAGSFEEIEKLSGVKIEDPHRPYVDDITWEDKQNGGTFRRVVDVLDVWYDSGAVPFAKLHYPFENKELVDNKVKFPAEYIAEGLDQVRLWFYTMHILGVALFDQVPYKNVVTNGMLADKTGEKLSKSKKNYPPMDDVLNAYGADVLRLFLLTSPIVQAESARYSEDALKDTKKEFFLPLWNSVRYFVTSANLNNFTPTLDVPNTNNVLDKWLLARSQQTINTVINNMDKYLFMPASRELPLFVQDLSTWYIRRSRDRLRDGDIEALNTLYYVLTQFTKLIAPMVPFISENFYEILGMSKLSNLESVHLDFYPKAKDLTQDQKDTLEQMQLTRDIVSTSLSIRVENNMKVRQPLGNLYIKSKKDEVLEFYADLVSDEVNVKNVTSITEPLENTKQSESSAFIAYLDTNITEELKLEGLAREMVRKLQDIRKEQGLNVSDAVNATYEATEENTKAVSMFGEYIKQKVLAKQLKEDSVFTITKL